MISYANGIRRQPCLTSSDATGICVSGWHKMFRDLGYPQLDIMEFADGEWCIIEYHQAPIIPSMTQWHVVLQGMRNIDITEGFIAKYVKQVDPKLKEFWDRENRKTKAVYEEAERVERHAEDSASRAHRAIVRNPDLMERIAKKGLQEMDVDRIRSKIPYYKF